MKILLDLDDVIGDFQSAACEAHGLPHDEMNITHGGLWWDGDPFWNPIAAKGVGFWEGIKPYPWMQEVIEVVRRYDPNFHIVTAGQSDRCPDSYTGKVLWLAKYMGKEFSNFTITAHKYLLAGPDVLLIDDSEKNCASFVTPPDGRPGGQAVLFPAVHNALRGSLESPVAFLTTHLSLREQYVKLGIKPARL